MLGGLALVSACSWAETDCSFDVLIEAYKEGNKALISKCSNEAETPSKPAKKSDQSVFTPEERKLIWGSASPEGSSSGESHSRSGQKTSSSPLAKSCEDGARIRAAKRDAASLRIEIADLNSEKSRLDERLRQFDARYESSKLSKDGRLMALLNAVGQGGVGAAGRRGEQLDREAAQKRQIYEDARFELQNQITEMKLLLNREIRNAQRYLDDAEDRIDRLAASECR